MPPSRTFSQARRDRSAGNKAFASLEPRAEAALSRLTLVSAPSGWGRSYQILPDLRWSIFTGNTHVFGSQTQREIATHFIYPSLIINIPYEVLPYQDKP